MPISGAGQPGSDRCLHFADAQTEAGQIPGTHAAGPCQGGGRLGLSGSLRVRQDRGPAPSPPPAVPPTAAPRGSPPSPPPLCGPSTCSQEGLTGQLGSRALQRANQWQEAWLCPPMAAPILTPIESGKDPLPGVLASVFPFGPEIPPTPTPGLREQKKPPSPRAWAQSGLSPADSPLPQTPGRKTEPQVALFPAPHPEASLPVSRPQIPPSLPRPQFTGPQSRSDGSLDRPVLHRFSPFPPPQDGQSPRLAFTDQCPQMSDLRNAGTSQRGLEATFCRTGATLKSQRGRSPTWG